VRGGQTATGSSELTFRHAEFDGTWRNYVAGRSLRDTWIEVGGLWTSNSICYFVNGVKLACENYTWARDNGSAAPPAHVLLNLAVGGQWAGRHDIDAAGFPISLDVDHVRIYRR